MFLWFIFHWILIFLKHIAIEHILLFATACTLIAAQNTCTTTVDCTCAANTMPHCHMGQCYCHQMSGHECNFDNDCTCDHNRTPSCDNHLCHCLHHAWFSNTWIINQQMVQQNITKCSWNCQLYIISKSC